MSRSQVDSGHAFEYGIACAFQRVYEDSILQTNSALNRAKESFDNCSQGEQDRIFWASDEVANFLIAHDPGLRIRDGYSIRLQSDMAGAQGDVRDIIIANIDSESGISAKNRHSAVKHPRLSKGLDFGQGWFGIAASQDYFSAILPIFSELEQLSAEGALWKDLPRKAQRFYIPTLTAFTLEVEKICGSNSEAPKKMVEYMLGNSDFYQVIKENGNVSIQSFNLRGSLGWGKRLKLPTRLIEARRKDGFENTVEITFDNGWQLSFRIHSAETRVIPSLKFDVRIGGSPNPATHHITYLAVPS